MVAWKAEDLNRILKVMPSEATSKELSAFFLTILNSYGLSTNEMMAVIVETGGIVDELGEQKAAHDKATEAADGFLKSIMKGDRK